MYVQLTITLTYKYLKYPTLTQNIEVYGRGQVKHGNNNGTYYNSGSCHLPLRVYVWIVSIEEFAIKCFISFVDSERSDECFFLSLLWRKYTFTRWLHMYALYNSELWRTNSMKECPWCLYFPLSLLLTFDGYNHVNYCIFTW